ncbi:flavin-containing monooxygenase [Streptomyces sp. NPDC048288]|uniref:flavin-containing monooxygenase n=1 Tax=Streptomyces sp. NPDC048288 TaxID=3365529 RepID=UPI003722CDBA
MTRTSSAPREAAPEHLDVVIVGAGLSGIGAGYRIRSECPDRSYAILEARDAIGGTWDLFRYPGVRSDSDMFTLGYPFRPWRGRQTLADGESVLNYVRDTAAESGVDRHIRFRTRLLRADWSTPEARWTLTVRETAADGTTRTRTLTCAFLYSCTGYYDYDRGHDPDLPGRESFTGTVVHPQFWPEDLDHRGRRVVVIGSGATAVTLVPAMARDAAHVTMLQRTPTWIVSRAQRDRVAEALRVLLPGGVAHRAVRARNILFGTAFYEYCRRRPESARALLTRATLRAVGDERSVRENFTPPYAPWDQRLCAVPEADLFRALRSGAVDVVTDRIETFVPEGVRLRSGRTLPADIVVTATGLRLLPLGGVAFTVDGRLLDLPGQFVWRGAMLTGAPNLAFCIGYTNASWTLRADLSSRLVCKVLNHMSRRGYPAVVPEPAGPLGTRPLIDLASGYVRRSIAAFPQQGDRAPWKVRQNYVLDSLTTLHSGLDRTLRPVPTTPAAPTTADGSPAGPAR